MKSEHVNIRVGLIDHCSWNPRGEITEESVADIAASIREKGLLQAIGVIAGDDGRYVAIYGNRRLVAFRVAAGNDNAEIPCTLYSDLTEEDAREITRIENEHRLGIDPLKDAELVESLLEKGKTLEHIATIFGSSPATICRRAKLINLDESIRKIVHDKSTAYDVNALERISLYPQDIQKLASKQLADRAKYQDAIKWRDVSHIFERLSDDLDSAAFVKDTSRTLDCTYCLKRTGCMANLFGDLDGQLGRCLDKKCFEKQVEAWKEAKLKEAIPDTVTERFEVVSYWELNNDSFKDKPSKSRPCAYFHWGWNNELTVKFGPSHAAIEAEREERRRLDEERAEADKEKREEIRHIREVIGSALSGPDEDNPHFDAPVIGYLRDFCDQVKNPYKAAYLFVVNVLQGEFASDIDDLSDEQLEVDAGLEIWDKLGDSLVQAFEYNNGTPLSLVELCPKSMKKLGITEDDYIKLKGAQ